MNRPSNIPPFPVDYAPNLYDSLEEDQFAAYETFERLMRAA